MPSIKTPLHALWHRVTLLVSQMVQLWLLWPNHKMGALRGLKSSKKRRRDGYWGGLVFKNKAYLGVMQAQALLISKLFSRK